MFKPEAYVDSVLDLLDDEQTLVAENIIKNPLDMQERYMSLVPDGLLDFIVKQWRPGMTSDQADKIFRKYSSFNQGGSVDFKVIGTPGGKVKPGIKYYGDNIVTPIKQGEHAGEYHLRLGGGDREVFYGSKDELEKVLSDYKLKVRQRTDIDVDLVKKLIEDANKGDKFKSPIDISDEYNKIKKTNIRLSGKTKDSPVYDILSTLESQDEKINKVFDSLLTSDQPVNFSFYEALPKDRRGETVANPWRSEIAGRTGIEQAKIKRVLNKNKDYLTNKNFFDYISKSKLGISELKDLPLNFQIEYAKEAVKGRPRFTGLDGQTNLTRDPNYKIMEFARRSWDNTKGKGQIKFFDKNGKPIEWKYGTTLPYKDVSFSYKGKNFGLNDLKQPGFSKKFFPEVVAKQEAINNLLVEEVYNPIRKKTTSFKQLANDVQVKGYGWEKRAGVMDILHGEKGVTEEPFTNLRYNSRDINLLENGLYSSFKAGKISEANYKLALNNLNKVFDEASPEEVSTLIKNRINIQAGKIVDNDFYGFDKFRDKTMNIKPGTALYKTMMQFCPKGKAQGGRIGYSTAGSVGEVTCSIEEAAQGLKEELTKNSNDVRKIKGGSNLLKTAGKFFGWADAPLEFLFALPHLMVGDTQGAKRATSAGLLGYGGKRIDEFGPESKRYVNNLKNLDKWFDKFSAIGNIELNLENPNLSKDQKSFLEKNLEFRKKEIDEIQNNYGKIEYETKEELLEGREKLRQEIQTLIKGNLNKDLTFPNMVSPEDYLSPLGNQTGPAKERDYPEIKNLREFKDKMGEKYAGSEGMFVYKPGAFMIAEELKPGLKEELYGDYIMGRREGRELEDLYSSLEPKYANQLSTLEKEDLLYGLKRKLIAGQTTKQQLEEQGFDIPQIMSARPYASGGIASLTTTIPPKRGPNSQGLASLKKYGKQY
jgi:hypothetical protein